MYVLWRGGEGSAHINQVNHTSVAAVVTLTYRPKSVRNRFEFFVAFL